MKKRRSGKNKYLFIALTLFIVLILLAIFSFNAQESRMKAGKYLHVAHTKSIGNFYNNGKTLVIKELGLNITAVHGDAHDIIIIVDSQVDIANDVYSFIGENETRSISVRLKGYTTSLNNGKFPVEIGISCREVSPDDIIIYVDPSDVVAPP